MLSEPSGRPSNAFVTLFAVPKLIYRYLITSGPYGSGEWDLEQLTEIINEIPVHK
jgi:hypothetical protein